MIEKLLDKFFKNDDVFFIGSSDILPPPLKKSVEEDLVRKSNLDPLLNSRDFKVGQGTVFVNESVWRSYIKTSYS